MDYEKIDSFERLQSRNRFLLKTLFPIITLTLFLTFYTFSTEFIFTIISPSIDNNDDVGVTTPLPALPSSSPPISSPSFDNEEKFLTYLPHSGFHNQRGAFMNAIMLSYLTNRTLIVPPVLVYYINPYDEFYPLYDTLNKTVKIKKYRMKHCKDSFVPNDDVIVNNDDDDIDDVNDDDDDGETSDEIIFNSPILCNKRYSKYDKFTMLNWEKVFNLIKIKSHVKMVDRGYDFSLKSLQEKFNITENQTYLFVENEQYEFRFFDNDDTKEGLERFKNKILLSDLLKIDNKLLHFSSLFSHYRIVLEREENIHFRHIIHNTLMVNDPRLLNVTDQISKRLGGKGSYFGLHIRVGDALFITQKEEHLSQIHHNLTSVLSRLGFSIKKKKEQFSFNLKQCLENNLPIIYIATDSKDPKKELKIFYDMIPCIFTLFDFKKEMENLGKIPSDFDENIDLRNFYIPLIDLLITSYGGIFIGTEGSTFSRMANEVHNLYMGKNAIGNYQ